MYTNKKQLIIWALSGFLISLGMNLGGMAHKTSMSFFDPMNAAHFASTYTPSLLFVFMAALLPGVFYWNFYTRPVKPLFDDKWHTPTNKVIDKWLVGGSVLFGFGWALGGFCPGPSVGGVITGHPTYVVFSYGMYVYKAIRGIMSPEDNAHPHHWLLTILLGLIPATFYFMGPTWFPITPLERALPWNMTSSILPGLFIATATLLFAHFNGKVLGISGFWRSILNVQHPINTRLPHILFFASFLFGAMVTYTINPQAFSVPPYEDRNLIWIFLGGALVGMGTEWSNGCTSGHGVSGLSRLSIRSMVAVPTFMGSVFLFVPLIKMFIV